MILFLDIDGVLNTGGAYARYEWVQDLDHRNWVPDLCFNLAQICLYTKCEIVISSSWRKLYSATDWWQRELGMRDIHSKVIGITPSSHNGFRGREVNEWLVENNRLHEKYICIDDSIDFYPHQPRIRTDGGVGLTKYDAMEVIDFYFDKTTCLNKMCMTEVER